MKCAILCYGSTFVPRHLQCRGMRPLYPPRGFIRACRPRKISLAASLNTTLFDVFSAVSEGRLSPIDAAQTVQESMSLSLNVKENTFPEVVMNHGQRYDLLNEKMQRVAQKQGYVMATGIEPVDYAQMRQLMPGVKYHAGAKVLTWEKPNAKKSRKLPGCVGIIYDETTSSTKVDEFKSVVEYFGCYAFQGTQMNVSKILDVISQMQKLQDATVFVVIYDQQHALPDVISGLTDAPVISISTGDQDNPVLPSESLSVSNSRTTTAAMSVAKILKSAERIMNLQQTVPKSKENLHIHIQDALGLIEEQEDSFNSSIRNEEGSEAHTVNNVVVNDCRETEIMSEEFH